MTNKLLINHKYIEIQCSRDDWNAQNLISQIPYVHSNRTKTNFRSSSRNITLVLKLFRGVDHTNVDSLPSNIREIWDKEMHKQIATKTLLEQGPQRPHGWLYVHQQLGRELAEVHDRYAFFYDTRTGKTPMSLQIIADDIEKNPDHKWLILCPLILIENAWLPDAKQFFPDMKVVNLHDRTKIGRAHV